MITVTVDNRLLQARLLQVAKGIKGGLRPAIAASAGRIGVNLARESFPISERGTLARKRRMIFRCYPSSGTIYTILKSWSGSMTGLTSNSDPTKVRLQRAKAFALFMSQGRISDAVNILNSFPPFRAAAGSGVSEGQFRSLSKQRAGAGDLSKNGGLPQVFWNCVLIPDASSARESLLQKFRKEVGRVANGWVTSGRYFRKGRSNDFLPKFKTQKQAIVTGTGRWEGSEEKPVAVLSNTYKLALAAMRPGGYTKALETESRNLSKQIVNQAKFEARKARLGR